MPTPVKTEPKRQSDWLIYEEDQIGRYSRDNVVIAANQTLSDGHVVGKNAGGEIVEYDNTDPDGGAAVGILVHGVSTGASVGKGVIIARHAMIAVSGLTFKTGLAAPDQTAALADLKALGILVRAEA